MTANSPCVEVFDRKQLSTLLAEFRVAVKRKKDVSLADRLEEELLQGDSPKIELKTIRRLAKWCRTGGIYRSGMETAREISLLIFGLILDRTQLRV